MRRHLRLNRQRQFECGTSLARRDTRRAAGPHRFKEGENFEPQRLAWSDFRLYKAQARRGGNRFNAVMALDGSR